ncbi:MAG: bacteriohemerythrin [Rhodospirillales bacterium]|nr:bacteriohemerythrin [Rhodospirillales bacterium]
MPPLDWNDEFETGIDYIDFEHRRLVTLVNQICDSLLRAATEDAVAGHLGQLHAQVCAHFALEEELMREKKYELFDVHKAEHEQLLEEIRYMMDAFEGGLCTSCGTTLDACLTAWLSKHFKTEDARFERLGP